jgi:hypothetical protein
MWVPDMINPDKSKKLKDGESYFVLKDYLDLLLSDQNDVEEWSFN